MNHSISRREFLAGAFGTAAATLGTTLKLPRRAFADDDQAADGAIVILHTNDVHCAVGEPGKDGSVPLAYSALVNYANGQKSLFGSDNVTLVDAGDAIQGKAIGTLTKGQAVTDIMDACGYEYAIPGNHEFDFGMVQFDHLTKNARAQYLSCNFTDKRSGAPTPQFDPYAIKTYTCKGDRQIKVAFVGVTTPATLTASTPRSFWRSDDDHTRVYGFCEDDTGEALVYAVQDAVDNARLEGANFVVLLAHLGQKGSPSIWRSDTVASRCRGIDIVIDGHSHEEYVQTVQDIEGKDVIITQTGTQFASVGQIVINPQTGRIAASTPNCEATLVCESKAPDAPAYIQEAAFGRDAATQELVQAKLDEVAQQTSIKVGTSLVDLYAFESDDYTWAVRSHETNLGDFVADAYLNFAWLNGVMADIAFVNGGGVRANVSAGDVTMGNLIDVNPYNNQLCYTNISGQDLLDALEVSASSYPDPSGEFLQVSEGLSFNVRTDIPTPVTRTESNAVEIEPTAARRIEGAKLHGEVIDPTRNYQLVCHSYYLIDGGGSYGMLQKGNVTLLDLDNVALSEYLKTVLRGTIDQSYGNATGSKRINLVDGSQHDPKGDETPEESINPQSPSTSPSTTNKSSKTSNEKLASTGDSILGITGAVITAGVVAIGTGAASGKHD